MLVGNLRTVGVILKHSKKELLLSPSIMNRRQRMLALHTFIYYTEIVVIKKDPRGPLPVTSSGDALSLRPI